MNEIKPHFCDKCRKPQIVSIATIDALNRGERCECDSISELRLLASYPYKKPIFIKTTSS